MATCVKGKRRGENGYTLLGVILLLAILTISLSVAIPKTIQDIQRDRELECVHRGEQYARAIRLFYRQTGNYPTDLAQLENTNNIRFLRKRYLDPITGGAWKLVYQGEVKPDLLSQLGQFFGGQLPAATSSTLPQGVVMGLTAGVPTPAFGYGSNGGVTNLLNPLTGQPENGPTKANALTPLSQSDPLPGSTTTSSTPLGNRRIVGVASISKAKSIRVYKKQTHYNDWQFVYNPAVDGIRGGGQPGLNGPSLSAAPAVPPPPSPLAQ